MDNIYEWLYDHYYKPREAEILQSCQPSAPELQAAEHQLLTGSGGQLERTDALALCRRATGVTAFAAGMYLSYRLLTDLDFLDN